MFTYVIILPFRELQVTVLNQLLWSEPALYSGVVRTLEKVDEPGKKLVWRLTLKIPELNGI